MKKKIIVISTIVVGLSSAALLVRYFINKKKKNENSNSGKTGSGSSNGSRGGSTNNGGNASNIGSAKVKTDAQKIYKALNLWTTDADEKEIVSIIKEYNPSSFKQLEKHFNKEYKFKVGNSIENDPLKVWLKEDLSDSNFDEIKSILG